MFRGIIMWTRGPMTTSETRRGRLLNVFFADEYQIPEWERISGSTNDSQAFWIYSSVKLRFLQTWSFSSSGQIISLKAFFWSSLGSVLPYFNRDNINCVPCGTNRSLLSSEIVRIINGTKKSIAPSYCRSLSKNDVKLNSSEDFCMLKGERRDQSSSNGSFRFLFLLALVLSWKGFVLVIYDKIFSVLCQKNEMKKRGKQANTRPTNQPTTQPDRQTDNQLTSQSAKDADVRLDLEKVLRVSLKPWTSTTLPWESGSSTFSGDIMVSYDIKISLLLSNDKLDDGRGIISSNAFELCLKKVLHLGSFAKICGEIVHWLLKPPHLKLSLDEKTHLI